MELTPEAMIERIWAHSDCEQARDWAGALATMATAPHYEFYPYRLRIEGDAIPEMWSRIFTEHGPIRCFDVDAHDPDQQVFQEYVSSDAIIHVMSGSFRDEHGVLRGKSQVVRYEFSEEGLTSETLWLDRTLMDYFDHVFDEEFRSLPGVSQM